MNIDYYIKTPTPEVSKQAQELLFALGYHWWLVPKKDFKHLTEGAICFGYNPEMSYASLLECIEDGAEEVTIKDLTKRLLIEG